MHYWRRVFFLLNFEKFRLKGEYITVNGFDSLHVTGDQFHTKMLPMYFEPRMTIIEVNSGKCTFTFHYWVYINIKAYNHIGVVHWFICTKIMSGNNLSSANHLDSEKLTELLRKKYPFLVMYDGKNDVIDLGKFYLGFAHFMSREITFAEQISSEFIFAFMRIDSERRRLEHDDELFSKASDDLLATRRNINRWAKELEVQILPIVLSAYQILAGDLTEGVEKIKEALRDETLDGLAIRLNILSAYAIDIINEVITIYPEMYNLSVSNKRSLGDYSLHLTLASLLLQSLHLFADLCERHPNLYQRSLQPFTYEQFQIELQEKSEAVTKINEEYEELIKSITTITFNNVINYMKDKKTKLRDTSKEYLSKE
ncbi:uncharacterized protein KLLA0_F09867g [Kluyveromyces lactis]|uniref:KLLA0F09867p n=1 Tax=Kluyveromyces lactis (strain ATCC 8585 / CBS 2359 / DSM 70799 / NBRC 1267 / NRRL Y-1140 / WM37) TaxID=284590 RepID=Q6CKL0_KLULA|nr:uncharacterized protein KLLA0_F09867g [Kluyveromyces lactis]CAG98237.1 KLLA0F09867p [Kluyveromyces lactis]|eukprot:XP_455529.1 uncharacterized protein KLLA0_F09867g [Kluyveromyces lactis]